MIYFIYKFLRRLLHLIRDVYAFFVTYFIFKGNNVEFSSFKTNGIPYIMVARGGTLRIGKNVILNNSLIGTPVFRSQPCVLFVDRNSVLTIDDNSGMSSVTIICHSSISVGKNVTIGRSVLIYDSDSHSLNPKIRISAEDTNNSIKKPIVIKDNVFIGARSIILKGVTIGENSIIGAGSVVTKSIPDNQIWAGNPAKFIRNI